MQKTLKWIMNPLRMAMAVISPIILRCGALVAAFVLWQVDDLKAAINLLLSIDEFIIIGFGVMIGWLAKLISLAPAYNGGIVVIWSAAERWPLDRFGCSLYSCLPA